MVEMLIAGSILSRILSQVFSLAQRYMTNDDLLTLQNLQLYGYGLNQKGSVTAFFIPILAALIPLILIRFSMNAVSFSADEARCMGLNTFRLSLLGLVCGTLLVVLAVLFCGDVGMLALMIPFYCRALFGADSYGQSNVIICTGNLTENTVQAITGLRMQGKSPEVLLSLPPLRADQDADRKPFPEALRVLELAQIPYRVLRDVKDLVTTS